MDPNGDGDMSDHLDVINMSLGSPFGDAGRSVGDLVARTRRTSASSWSPPPATKAHIPYITGAPAVAPRSDLGRGEQTRRTVTVLALHVTAPRGRWSAAISLEGAGPVTLASDRSDQPVLLVNDRARERLHAV